MNAERDKFIVEQLGGCWHEWAQLKGLEWTDHQCMKCLVKIKWDNPGLFEHGKNLSTWPGFGWAWEKAQGMEWWNNFLFYAMWGSFCGKSIDYEMSVSQNIIHPDRFANAHYEFLKEKSK